MYKKLLIILWLTATATILPAYSLYDLFLGSEVPHHDARATAMGGTGTAGGFTLMDSSLNPANLYYLQSSGTAQFTYSLIKNSENRAIPLWNFFDSYFDESTYARNENFYNELSGGVYYGLDIANTKLSLAITTKPLVNFGAHYSEEVRNFSGSDDDAYPVIVAKNFIDTDGMLNTYNLLINFGSALPFNDASVAVGAEISYATGKYDYERRLVWSDYARDRVTNLEDTRAATTNKIDGLGYSFGISASPHERWRIGYTFTPKMTLNFDGTTYHNYWDDTVTTNQAKTIEETPDDYIIPQKMRLGLLFMPRNPYKTNFQFDFEVINYSELNVTYPTEPQKNRTFDNGYAVHIGVEHYVGHAIPLRIGFSHKTAKQDKSISLPSVSLGTGFEIIDNLHLDIAGEYGKREYTDLDLFPDGAYNKGNTLWGNNYVVPADRGWGNPDIVTESFLKVFTSLYYTF